MGSDIYTHVEVKIKGEWHHYSILPIEQDYRFFGLLAGVRKPNLQVFTVKGLPEDLTIVTRWDLNDDAHHCSYLNAEEMQSCMKRHQRLNPKDENLIEREWLDIDPDEFEDIRLVFWFKH